MSRRSIVILVVLSLAFIIVPALPLTDSGTEKACRSEPKVQEATCGSADVFGGNLHMTTARTTSAREHVQPSAENDTTPPTIANITWSPSDPLSNEAIDVYVTVTDESGVDRVLLDYYDGSLSRNLTMGLVSYPPPQYWASIPALGKAGTIEMWVLAWDLEGNLAWTNTTVIEVQLSDDADITPPTIGDITWSPSDPLSNEAIDVYVTVTDESGVGMVLLGYSDGIVPRNLTMTLMSYPPPQYWVPLPALGKAGTIEMWVLAWDLEGNLAWTDYVQFDIQQAPPVTTTPFITTSTTTVTTGELLIIIAAIVVFAGIPAALVGWHGMGRFLRRR